MAYYVDTPLHQRDIDPAMMEPGTARDSVRNIVVWLDAESMRVKRELDRRLAKRREEDFACITGHAYPPARWAGAVDELIGCHDTLLAIAGRLREFVTEWEADEQD